MDLLKAEIAKKRALLQEKSLLGPQKKYFKREELLKKLDEDYWAQNKAKEDQRSSSVNEESRMVKVGDDSKMDSGSSKEDRILPRKEVIRRLRERMEPILLFGETENEAFQRLRHLELLEPENNRGLRNDFQEAMEKVDQEFLQELINNGGNRDGESVKQRENDVQIEDMNTSIEEVKQLAANLGKRKEDSSEDCRTVWTFLKFLLEMWGKRLNSRPEHIKMATQGKIASATYTQTVTYLRPLFKQLKSNKVADDILKHLTLIVRFLLERDYVKANDAYLQMAIGNSPWPIGVTMVGIHARTGREKIFSQNIAHVLNDESQRKYIQGLKRLITQCQKIFPTDPSKSVEYNAVNQDIFC